MTKKLFKSIMSSMLAIIMLFAVVIPSYIRADESQKTKVSVHKILMDKGVFNDFQVGYTGKDNTKYDGRKINNIDSFFGTGAKEIEGVAFSVYKQDDSGDKTGTQLGLNDEDVKDKKFKLVQVNGSDVVVTKNSNGAVSADFTLENGTYIFVEVKEKSPYFSTPEGKELTEAKAVPFKLQLPITKPDGTGYFSETDPLHVYPKNTEDVPVIDKTFEDGSKTTKNVMIGEEIPYKVTTKIPKGSTYKTLKWTDTMVKGLDFKTGSLTITSKELESENLTKETDYKITETKRGFVLEFTNEGLTKIEKIAKEKEVNITLAYKAELNKEAIIDTEIPNEIKLDYGNRPSFDSSPKPVTPKEEDGKIKIKITKEWEETLEKRDVNFVVYEKETGKEVGKITITKGQSEGTLETGLEKNKEYIVIEEKVAGTLPEYKNGTTGELTIKNKKNPNPDPLKPEPPKVITYGKKFVKIDSGDENKKLSGAEFKILNDQGQYLALKDVDEKTQEIEKYKTAEKAYQDEVAKATTENPNTEEINKKKLERDKAYETLSLQWRFVNEDSKAFVFISDQEGKIEVKGLKQGIYKLKETKAPSGYALPSSEFEFTVNKGSYSSGDIKFTQASQSPDAQKVVNKKVTIPQTGGVGTLIFAVVGISLMGVAIYAMKRRNSEEK